MLVFAHEVHRIHLGEFLYQNFPKTSVIFIKQVIIIAGRKSDVDHIIKFKEEEAIVCLRISRLVCGLSSY